MFQIGDRRVQSADFSADFRELICIVSAKLRRVFFFTS